MITPAQIKAAQEVFEQWFCEELGLDMDSTESASIIQRMLEAANSARVVKIAHVVMPCELTPEQVLKHATCQNDEMCRHRWNPLKCEDCQEDCANTYREFVRDLRII